MVLKVMAMTAFNVPDKDGFDDFNDGDDGKENGDDNSDGDGDEEEDRSTAALTLA